MKTKSFTAYLEKRFNKNEITQIKEQAQLEIRILRWIQKFLADTSAVEPIRAFLLRAIFRRISSINYPIRDALATPG